MPAPLWEPSPGRIAQTNLTRFSERLAQRTGRSFAAYADLHQFSVTEPAAFWPALWEFVGIIGEPGDVVVRDFDRMPGASFFPNARLSFAENLLKRRGPAAAILATTEDGRE